MAPPNRCQYYDICGLEAIADPQEHLCILHSKRQDKNRKEFRKALQLRLKKKDYRFNHFFFPADEFNFIQWVFENSVTFDGAIFSGKVNFIETRFMSEVSFHDTCFDNDANFSRAIFESKANFDRVRFKDVHFYDSTFKDISIFTGARFDGVANFTLTDFKATVFFNEAIFNDRAFFYQGAFECEVSFKTALFKDMATFVGKEDAFLFSKKHETNFVSVLFEQPSKVYFDSTNLSKCSFLRTDLMGVNFTKVEWAKIHNRKALYDELKVVAEKKKEDYPLVEELYTLLKHHWEEKRNYEMAGFFHYGEKEMRRKARSFFSDPALWLYWIFSGYGESATKAFLWLLLIWVGFALYYAAFSITSVATSFLNRILHSLNYSLQVMTFQKLLGSSFAETIQSILGPIIIALFVLALRRRMSR